MQRIKAGKKYNMYFFVTEDCKLKQLKFMIEN